MLFLIQHPTNYLREVRSATLSTTQPQAPCPRPLRSQIAPH